MQRRLSSLSAGVTRFHPRPYWRRWAILLFIISSTILIAYGLVRLTTIRKIKVSGAAYQVNIAWDQYPSSLLLFPVKKAEREIVTRFATIDAVSINRQWPDTLAIELTLREPVATMPSEDGRYLLIDRHGVAYADLQNESVPRIETQTRLVLGKQVINARILPLFEFLYHAPERNTIRSIQIASLSGEIRIQYPETTVHVGSESNPVQTAETLQSLFIGFRMKGSMPREIDLRFSQPVVIP